MNHESDSMLARLRKVSEAFHASLPKLETTDKWGREVECRYEIVTGQADCGLPDRYASIYEVWLDGEDIVDELDESELDYLTKECEEAD